MQRHNREALGKSVAVSTTGDSRQREPESCVVQTQGGGAPQHSGQQGLGRAWREQDLRLR